jgi:hypothetical protein
MFLLFKKHKPKTNKNTSKKLNKHKLKTQNSYFLNINSFKTLKTYPKKENLLSNLINHYPN